LIRRTSGVRKNGEEEKGQTNSKETGYATRERERDRERQKERIGLGERSNAGNERKRTE
jgi:hypothetical protein